MSGVLRRTMAADNDGGRDGEAVMVQTVQATYRDGVLEPSESLDLEDGDVVMLSISISVEGGVGGWGCDRVGVGWWEW